ncbi:YciI family protein [Sphaerisporangium sp. NPDC049002]|uniref:YciI family protein n=1 Tax=unclassified Sphaerisporangium TaxID=2630420 RepID=UPI0033DAE5A2
MAQFAILLYAPAPADWSETPQDELEAHGTFAEKIGELGGSIVTGYALQPSSGAKAVRSDGVTDGPLIDAKEVLGGITVIEARDLDHAVEIAKESPGTWRGGVEVRELLG